MRKDTLRALRSLPATKEMMLKGKRFTEREEKYSYFPAIRIIIPEYDVLFRVQNLSGFIKVAVFIPSDMRKDIKTPRYEIFVNEEGGEYITRELDENGEEKKWLTAMLNNLTDVPCFAYWNDKLKYFISRDGMDTLNRLKLEHEHKKPSKGPFRLQDWMREQKDNETRRKEEKEQKPWDEDMKLVPELPKSFTEWMRRDAANEYYMIYEYDRKGAKTGFCTKCRKVVPISGAKHGKETKCPACRVRAQFKSHNRIRTLSTGSYFAEIIQSIKGGIAVRTFEQKQGYWCKDYKKPDIFTHEFNRTLIFEDGTVKNYQYGLYKNKKHRWIEEKGYIPERTYYWERRIPLYKKNMAQIKKNPVIQKSAIGLWEKIPYGTVKYLAIEKRNPEIEMLARIGMFRLAKDLMNGSIKVPLKKDETELAKILGIDKQRLKRLKSMDGNAFHLRWMQFEKNENTIWPDEMIKGLGEAKILESDFGFLEAPISFVKCYNYLKKQAALSDETMHQTLITWRDYINMADSLKMNTKNEQIARPKRLKQAHDELILIKQKDGMEKQAKKIEKDWPKVNAQLPKLEKFEFTLGEYTIIAPKNVLDIVKEGTILRHCVHTCDYYFSRISTDESYLFFLRKSSQPDVPWYTLEVEPSGNIRQKRTTGDNQNEDFKKAVKFLKKWQQYFKKQLTKEEKALGEKANQLRIENYKKLRADGNRVWHGKLAGQLLADVLEKDFMEAM